MAAVLVTATLPPFARAGSRIDVTVSAIGDAKSLLGGTLVMTPLNAADGEIYAVAQGTVIAGGASAEGDGGAASRGRADVGHHSRRRAGRTRDRLRASSSLTTVRLALRNPDFTTAERIETAINGAFGRPVSEMPDSGTVVLRHPGDAAGHAGACAGADREPDGRTRDCGRASSSTSGRARSSWASDVRISQRRGQPGQPDAADRGDADRRAAQPLRARARPIVVPRTDAAIDEEDGHRALPRCRAGRRCPRWSRG